MAKLRLYWCMLFLIVSFCGYAQYQLKITVVDKDSLFLQKNTDFKPSFKSQSDCLEYINGLPILLKAKGFINVSIDSVYTDSVRAIVQLYIGDSYKWGQIKSGKQDDDLLEASGWSGKKFSGKQLDFNQFKGSQQQVLNYMENNGYPFAKIYLDSIILQNNELAGKLKIDRGPLYKIDSIRAYGSAKISTDFLQRYLNIRNGSIYKKEKLESISKKIMELPYIQEQQPWKLMLLGTGSVLDLYLKPKKSSQIDALVGFLPSPNTNGVNTSSKLLITGQATINLKNALGNGEAMSLSWQQLQPKTPRFDISYMQPYLFKSPFGINTSFSLFKKDSTFININFQLGAQYFATSTQTSTVFIQFASSSLLKVDTMQVLATRKLPDTVSDVSSVGLGLNYEFNNTNYRFNPRRGNELLVTGIVGTKTIKKNNTITSLTDPTGSGFSYKSLYDSLKLKSYQFRIKLQAAHYFQMGRASSLKLGMNAGIFQSPNNFLNELFLIGGYKLLRGFDEESIYASQYTVGTLEYRYLIGMNSFLFSFFDAGWAKNNISTSQQSNTYMGAGLGLAFETKAGIFNISYALGKQGSNSFNFRAAKIHLGYVAFF